MKILAVDPGNTESAYVIWDGLKIKDFNKVDNKDFESYLYDLEAIDQIIFEQVACYGMPVGEDVFETVFWTGRFANACDYMMFNWGRMKRNVVKMHLCNSARAKDSNIVTALVDRFDSERKFGKYGKGVKKNPGFFYGFYKDIWQAFALAVTYYDLKLGG